MNSMRAYPNIFDFTDYRAFLVAYFEDAKKRNPKWSYQAWAKKLSLKNNSSLLKIIHREREIGPSISGKLADYFEWKGDRRDYFNDLIRLSKIKDDSRLKVELMERLQLKLPKNVYRFLNEKEFSAISNWWCYAIRQMTKLSDFKGDPKWMAKKLNFKVPLREIRKAIQILLELRLIKMESARLAPTDGSLNTSDDVASEAIKRFHEGMISNAKIAVREIPISEREISGCTITISQEDFSRIKQYLRNFEDQFCRLFDKKDGDQVCQLNLQFFPLTKGKQTNHNNKGER